MVAIEKNKRETIRAEATEYQGHKLVSVRTYFRNEAGEWCPSKKGIAFRRELLPQIIAALQEIAEEVSE